MNIPAVFRRVRVNRKPAKYSVIVQYRIKGWGDAADLDRRHELEDLLDESLRRTRNGECDGGDIGSGTFNIFLTRVTDPVRACTTIVETLEKAGELEGAVIALSLDPEGEKEEGPYHAVLWPKDYEGEFNIMGGSF